jgi:hypothetical protein
MAGSFGERPPLQAGNNDSVPGREVHEASDLPGVLAALHAASDTDLVRSTCTCPGAGVCLASMPTSRCWSFPPAVSRAARPKPAQQADHDRLTIQQRTVVAGTVRA